jgi:hypothetical protein
MKYKIRKYTRLFLIVVMVTVMMISLSSCAMIDSIGNDVKGAIIGNSFYCHFYDNSGQEFMTVHGRKINMESNIIREYTYGSDGWYYTNTMSSVVTITIDGSQIESCGSTILFVENGLTADVDFNAEELKNIQSSSNGISSNTGIASIVNEYKNMFGKPIVVVIQSQLGDPICAFSGKTAYWEVCEDLPKTTKIMIDGKALYIHRANFQILDTDLLD